MRTQRSLMIMLAMFMLFLSFSVISAETSKKVNLIVTVTDSDGKPVGNAKVNVWYNRILPLSGTPAYQGDTTPDGVAVIPVETTTGFFSSKPQLSLIIRVVKTDFEVSQDQVSYSGQIPNVITRGIRLRKSNTQPRAMTLAVHVQTADGKPVEGAQVDVWANIPYFREHSSGQTDSSGDANVPVRKFDDFEIKVNKEGYPEAILPVKLSGTLPDVAGPFTVKLPKPKGTVVTINVRDEKDNQGVADARVVLNGTTTVGFHSATTNSSGTATITVPETGSFSVKITQSNYESFTGGEVRILQGEEKQSFEFALTPKPKKNEGANSVSVTVMAADKSDPTAIVSSNLPLSGASVTIIYPGGQSSQATDSGGHVTIPGNFEGNVQVVVEAEGYNSQTKTVNVVETVRAHGSHPSVSFFMQAEKSEDNVSVTVVTTKQGEEGQEQTIPVEGATVTAGGTTVTTDGGGHATLKGFFDNESITVEKTGFKSQVQAVSSSRPNRFSKGVATASVTFTLKPIASEDTVDVLVQSINPETKANIPISGATVTVGDKTGTTDSSGHAKFKGKFGETAQVSDAARGYGHKTTSVTISQPNRTGSATISLQPNLRLIVEVRDSSNKPIDDAAVYLQMQNSKAGVAGTHYTNAQGEAKIEIADDPVIPLEKLRSGMRLYVGKEKYETKLTDISSELLQSTEPRRITVHLERDWSELRKAIEELEKKIMDWYNDARGTGTNAAINNFIDKAVTARKNAETLLKEIEAAREAFGQTLVPGVPGEHCRKAEPLQKDIRAAEAEANQKAEELRKTLDDATAAAPKCESPADVDSLRNSYRKAIRLIADIGKLNKKAVKDRDELLPLAQKTLALKNLLSEMQGKLGQISKEAEAADENAQKAADYYRHMAEASKTLISRQITLKGQLAVLTVKAQAEAPLPSDLEKKLTSMETVITSQNNSMSTGTQQEKELPPNVTNAAATINNFKFDATKLISQYSAAACNIDTLDEAVNGINSTLSNSSFEIGLAADLPKQANECAKKTGGTEIPITDTTTPEDTEKTDTSKETPQIEQLPEDKTKTKEMPSAPEAPAPTPTVEKIPEDKITPPKVEETPEPVASTPSEQPQPETIQKPPTSGSENTGESSVGATGVLSGTWVARMNTTDFSQGAKSTTPCTMVYTLSLSLTGKNTFAGPLYASGTCPYQKDRGFVANITLVITGSGKINMTLKFKGRVMTVPTTYTSTQIILPIPWGEMTFIKQSQ